ncbi:MAG: DEAD/DEAH box helicase [Asgard group archaeon]|jgi:superfamily II DNA or RNA helicase|nr:DEAD/DEAH box helicase [Asgard group archaeon]
MMDKIFIAKYDEAFNIVTATDAGIEMEISAHFTIPVPGAHFMPAFKRGMWDGKIRLYNTKTNLLYAGLKENLEQFAEKRGYKVECEHKQFADEDFSVREAQEFVKSLDLPDYIKLDDYQLTAFISSIRKKRRTFLSATGSGKSLMIYLVCRYLKLKTLVITPQIHLVDQLVDNFKEYGYNEYIHKINTAKDKDSDALFNFTTWQSVMRMSRDWFNQFDCVIVDECHGVKAKQLTGILEKLNKCKYRLGFTGTLDGKLVNKWVIEGLLGPVKVISKTHELIEKNRLNPFEIRIIILHYGPETTKIAKKFQYFDEIDFLLNNGKRNSFLKKLITSFDHNSVTMTGRVKHGKELYELIKEETGDEHTYYFSGAVKGDIRNEWRKAIEDQTGAKIIAIDKVFSTGINITSLKNIVFAQPSKARIQILQSIGRTLRKHNDKGTSFLFDIGDNLTHGKRRNYTLRHLMERIKIYDQEKLPYKIYNVKLE